MYVSNAQDGDISIYGMYAGTLPAGMDHIIDPHGKFMIACSEKSDRLAVRHIDQADGGLRLLRRYPAGQGANRAPFVETGQREPN